MFPLAKFQEALGLDEQEVQRRFGASGGQVQHDVRYEGLEHMTQYYNPSVLPARLYVRDGQVQLVYVPAGGALADTTPADIDAQVGGRGHRVRSRAGKTANQYVQAERGVAYSEDGDEVDFVEIFAPRSLQAYLRDIYRDPGEFIR